MDRLFGGHIDEGQRLIWLVNLYYQAHMWMIGWLGKDPHIPHEFPVNNDEIDALGLNREELLSLLIANDQTHPWIAAIRFFDYKTFDGEVMRAEPGMDLNGTQVVNLYLKPDPSVWPYPQFLQTFIDVCEKMGVKHEEQLFKCQEITFSDPLRFITFLEHSGNEVLVIQQKLHDWHVCELALLNHMILSSKFGDMNDQTENDLLQDKDRRLIIAFLRSNLQSLNPHDPRLCWIKLSRKEMSQILGSAVRTIRKWDQKGVAPGNLPWPDPEKDSSAHRLYPLAKYILAMQRLQWNRSGII